MHTIKFNPNLHLGAPHDDPISETMREFVFSHPKGRLVLVQGIDEVIVCDFNVFYHGLTELP